MASAVTIAPARPNDAAIGRFDVVATSGLVSMHENGGGGRDDVFHKGPTRALRESDKQVRHSGPRIQAEAVRRGISASINGRT